MSVLSDDTDVLLLIPPDFFSVPSDSEDDSISVKIQTKSLLVSDLITQVNDLEGRICMIEKQSLCQNMPSNGNLQNLKHFGSADTLNTSYKSSYNSRSLQTTPMKTHTLPSPAKSWRTGLNWSPAKSRQRIEGHSNMLMSHEYLNQKEKDDQLLKEIHKFFKQKNNKTDRDCDSTGKTNTDDKSISGIGDNVHLSAAVFNLNKVNDLLKQLEETQAEIEQKLKLKGLNTTDSDENISLDHKVEDLQKPITDSLSDTNLNIRTPRRFLNFDYLSPKKSENLEEETKLLKVKNESTKATQNTESGSTTTRLEDKSTETTEEKVESPSSELTNLLSLCDLWGNSKKDDVKVTDDQKVLKQKYQEEKCRRQHCEDLIQKLQVRLLEEQQKIAVAIKVDQEKDDAISKLTEGWNKLANHWKDLESQRNNLAKKLQTEREKFQSEVSVACQTVKRYETELSKALDLAHGYKEKCEASEKEKKTIVINAGKEIESLKKELREAIERLEASQEKIEKLEKLVEVKEEALNQAKSRFSELQNQIRELKKSLKDQHTELEVMKHDKEKLSERLKEEKNKVSSLEQSKKALMQGHEEFKKKEKSMKETIKSMTEQMEKVKVELKEYYQDQVEKIVQEKLKEFQEQLSTAEKALQNEIEAREKSLTEMAVKQVQQIVEKHVVEVNLLEEKHNEEIELWRIKMLQAEEKVKDLQKKLEYYSSHKTEIAQKLQSIMETQWKEALRIITASSPQHQKSPLNSGRSDCAKGLNRQKTFTMTSAGWGDGSSNKNSVPTSENSPSVSSPTETPFTKDGQVTSREQLKTEQKVDYRIDETPQKISSDTSVDPLKKYIQRLLERPPGLPIDSSLDKSFDSAFLTTLTDESHLLQWQHILSERSSQANTDSTVRSKDLLKSDKENKWK